MLQKYFAFQIYYSCVYDNEAIVHRYYPAKSEYINMVLTTTTKVLSFHHHLVPNIMQVTKQLFLENTKFL